MKVAFGSISGVFCSSCGYAMHCQSERDPHKSGTANIYCPHGSCCEYKKNFRVQLPRYELMPLVEGEGAPMKLAMEINVTPRIECSEGVYAAFATVLGTEVFNTGPTEREAIERLEHSVRMILKVELGAKF